MTSTQRDESHSPPRTTVPYLEASDGDEVPSARDDDELAELAELALEYLRSDPRASGDGFVTWLEASLRSDPPRQTGDAVDLMTFHRARDSSGASFS